MQKSVETSTCTENHESERSAKEIYNDKFKTFSVGTQFLCTFYKFINYLMPILPAIVVTIGLAVNAYRQKEFLPIFIFSCVRTIYALVEAVFTIRMFHNCIAYGIANRTIKYYFSTYYRIWIAIVKFLGWLAFIITGLILHDMAINDTRDSDFKKEYLMITTHIMGMIMTIVFPVLYFVISSAPEYLCLYYEALSFS